MRPGITFTHFGVAVDERMRVVANDGRAVDNLFAAGMIMAANVLGRGYLAGLGVTLSHRVRTPRRRGGRAPCRPMNSTDEAERVLRICTACMYCDGLCAVFPAIAGKHDFDADRPELPRQPLPQLPRLLLCLPIRAAAPVRRQPAADARRRAAALLRRLRLAAACCATVSTPTPSSSPRSSAASPRSLLIATLLLVPFDVLFAAGTGPAHSISWCRGRS